MTIETQQGKKSWIGDGSTTNYPYSYPFLNASDIEVYLDGEKQASGFSVQNKTDYSTGANIIFDVAPAEGVLIVIRRNVPMTQEISYPENGEFPAKSHEKSLDKLTMLIIDNNKETLKVGPATPEDFDATFPVPEANKALKITADGKGFTMSDYDPDTALALTEDFKDQAQQAAIDALSSQTAAANSETIATQQANIATEKTAEVVESGITAVQNIDTAFSVASEWFSRLNAIPYIPVGTILPTTGAIDESLGYQRYANGQLIANVSSQAPDLVKFLEFQETHAPNLLCSETEWQTALTLSTLGQVGKYVWNKEEDSIRIPRIVNIQGMMNMNTIGNMVEAGSPNILATFGWKKGVENPSASGAIKIKSTANTAGSGHASYTSNNDIVFELDASSFNPIYGNSDTVQEESILYPYVLQIATGVQYKTPVQNELMSNNPFFFGYYQFFEVAPNNISWLKSAAQWNSATTHGDYYNWLAEERINPKDIPVRANVTKVGNVIDNDGVLSGFSASNYAVLPNTFNVGNLPWEIVFKIRTGEDVATTQYFFGAHEIAASGDPVIIGCSENKFRASLYTNAETSLTALNTNKIVAANTDYIIKLTFTGTSYKLFIDNIEEASADYSSSIYSAKPIIGVQSGSSGSLGYPWLGSIDLNESYININGQRWWTGMKSKVRLHTEDYDDYDWVINQSNRTFRLPLKVLGASGKAVVGNGMTLGLTNDGGNFGVDKFVNNSSLLGNPNAYGVATGSSVTDAGIQSKTTIGVTTDPTKSGIETSTQGLSLYFYVGGVAKNEHLVNVGRIEEKVDTLISDNSNLITNYCSPDWSRKVSKVVNTTYTAETDGLLFARVDGATSGVMIYINEILVASSGIGTNWLCATNCQISKGDTYRFVQSGGTYIYGYFVPMKGVN